MGGAYKFVLFLSSKYSKYFTLITIALSNIHIRANKKPLL